ncbi:MAG: hypothetical protein K6U78_18570 [Anaerolineae bacterium]|nr:hypothetical protein [Anaerolineae bacterium]
MTYDPNRHHRRSIRLRGYDYSQAGAYFVTIVTQNREPLFGEIVNGEMRLNESGACVVRWWEDIPRHFPGVDTDAFVVMPNHVHGIIVITDADNVGAGSPRPYAPIPPQNTPGTDAVAGADMTAGAGTPAGTGDDIGAGSPRPTPPFRTPPFPRKLHRARMRWPARMPRPGSDHHWGMWWPTSNIKRQKPSTQCDKPRLRESGNAIITNTSSATRHR